MQRARVSWADRVAENDLARSRKRRCSDENKRAGRVKRTSHLSRPPGVASIVLDYTAATRAQRETRSERCLCSLPRCLGPLEDRGNLGWRQKNAQPRGGFVVPRDDRHRPYSYFEDRCVVDRMCTKDPCEWRALPRSLSMPPSSRALACPFFVSRKTSERRSVSSEGGRSEGKGRSLRQKWL